MIKMEDQYELLSKEYENFLSKIIPIGSWDSNDKSICYIMYNEKSKLYKIGITNDLIPRWRSIGYSCGMLPKLVIAIDLQEDYDEPANKLEMFLHSFYKSKRRIGEWFELTSMDIKHIQQLFWSKIEGESIIDNIPKYLTSNQSLSMTFY